MSRRIVFLSACERCIHNIGNCIFNGESKCEKFADNSDNLQLQQKDIKDIRENILNNVQNGICLICKNPIKEGEACLDHHHQKKVKGSGLIRGVLCRTCNSFIAKSENNAVRFRISIAELPIILRNTADYLEKQQYPYIHPSEKLPPKYISKSSYNKLKKVYKGKKSFPIWPVSGKLKMTKLLQSIYNDYNMEPEYYK